MAPLNLTRLGPYSNTFLGLNWLKRNRSVYLYGYPIATSQYRSSFQHLISNRSAVKEFSFFLPFLASVFIFMVKPTKDGMIEYGTWPGLYVPFPF